ASSRVTRPRRTTSSRTSWMRSRETIIRLSWLTELASASRKAFRFARTTSSGDPAVERLCGAGPRFVAAPEPARFLGAAVLRAPPLRAEADLAGLFRLWVALGCGMTSPPGWARDLPYPPDRDRSP